MIVSWIGLIILFIKKNVHTRLNIFKHYFLAYSIMIIVMLSCHYFFLNISDLFIPLHLLNHFTDFLFTITEFYLISRFLKPDITPRIYKLGTITFYIGALYLFSCSLLSNYKNDFYYLQTIFNIQSVIVLIFCFDFFYKLNHHSVPFNRSVFWVVTGISILMICSLPFTLLSYYLIKNNSSDFTDLFSIIHTLYTILFLLIIFSIMTDTKKHNQRLTNQL